jgi:hypothetical protein
VIVTSRLEAEAQYQLERMTITDLARLNPPTRGKNEGQRQLKEPHLRPPLIDKSEVKFQVSKILASCSKIPALNHFVGTGTHIKADSPLFGDIFATTRHTSCVTPGLDELPT